MKRISMLLLVTFAVFLEIWAYGSGKVHKVWLEYNVVKGDGR